MAFLFTAKTQPIRLLLSAYKEISVAILTLEKDAPII